jgi:hypothetical protein
MVLIFSNLPSNFIGRISVSREGSFNTAMRPGHRLIGTAQMTARNNVTPPRQYPDLRAFADSSDSIRASKASAKTPT